MRMVCIISSMLFLALCFPSFSQETILGRIKDVGKRIEIPEIPRFDIPGTDVLANVAAEKAVKFASDNMVSIAVGLSDIRPRLEVLGYHIFSVQFEMLPPVARWCIASIDNGSNENFIDSDIDGGTMKWIMHAASSAKKTQSILGFSAVVINVEVSKTPNIYLSYYTKMEIDRISGGNRENYDAVCAHSNWRLGRT